MAEFDNRETVVFGCEEIEVLASNGACVIYADQFQGAPGVTGRLKSDLIDLYAIYTKVNGYDQETGKPIEGASGRMIDYEDVPSIVGIVWAMARAAGSTKLGFAKFRERFFNATSAYNECDRLFDKLIFDLAQRAFFRQPEGQPDAD